MEKLTWTVWDEISTDSAQCMVEDDSARCTGDTYTYTHGPTGSTGGHPCGACPRCRAVRHRAPAHPSGSCITPDILIFQCPLYVSLGQRDSTFATPHTTSHPHASLPCHRSQANPHHNPFPLQPYALTAARHASRLQDHLFSLDAGPTLSAQVPATLRTPSRTPNSRTDRAEARSQFTLTLAPVWRPAARMAVLPSETAAAVDTEHNSMSRDARDAKRDAAGSTGPSSQQNRQDRSS